MKYNLYFPKADLRGSTMLDYIMGERPKNREYEMVYKGEVDYEQSITVVLDFLWKRHNVGDDPDSGDEDGNRPRATEIRSMCIGDLIFIEGRMWEVKPQGFDILAPCDWPYIPPQLLKV